MYRWVACVGRLGEIVRMGNMAKGTDKSPLATLFESQTVFYSGPQLKTGAASLALLWQIFEGLGVFRIPATRIA